METYSFVGRMFLTDTEVYSPKTGQSTSISDIRFKRVSTLRTIPDMKSQTIEQYEELIEQSADIIALFDEAGLIQFVSPSAEQILGYTPDELVGEPAFDLIHPDDRADIVEAFERIVETPDESTERQEHRFRHADGSWIWAESVTRNRLDSSLEGYVINSREITERKYYQEQLEEKTEAIQVLNRILRHDIRNDMSIIFGWGEILEEHVDDPGQEHLQKILTSGKHVIELTENARDYAETLANETQIEGKPTPLRTSLMTEISLRRESFSKAEFIVSDEIPDVAITANEMLGSVFKNLLNNAVQHNDKDKPTVEISCEVGDEMVTVRIADNGPGIPDDRKESIFGKGEKGLASPGTGLGLYLVRTLVNQYGGNVWAANNDPTGTTFVVQLPIAE